MPNKFNNPMGNQSGTGGAKAANAKQGTRRGDATPEKCPNYPGVPGKTQPRDRSGGDRKVKQYPQSEGL